MSEVAVFVNPAAQRGRRAGRTRAALAALQSGVGPEGMRLVDTPSVADVHARSAELVAQGTARIVVIGGDGLVHHVVQALAGRDTVLGIMAVGTGNDIAAALGLPTKAAEAAKVALGPARTIDLLRCVPGSSPGPKPTDSASDGRWAVSVATVGFSAAVNERAEGLRWPRGSARYSLATMLELPHLRAVELEIELLGSSGATHHRIDAALVAVGNTLCFGGGMRICPTADPADGLADITVIEAVGRVDLLRHFARVFRGTHVRHRSVSTHRAHTLTLRAVHAAAHPAISIRADGEAWGQLPVTIEVVPGALRVAAPVGLTIAAPPSPADPDVQ